MTIHVNGIELYYEQSGSGRPLVMLHGNGEEHSIFDEAVAALKDRFTCCCPDSRGHGRSTAVSVFHYEDMAADMAALLEALDLRDVVFYGFSDGGIVGLLTAARSKRIGTLIVSGTNLTPRGVKARWRLQFRLMNFFKRDPLLQLMIREPQIGPEMLKRITARTLVLAGSRDLIRERETRRIAAAIPGAELRILDGEDHGSYVVHSTKIARIIQQFVSPAKGGI